jgi:hypothetical protein
LYFLSSVVRLIFTLFGLTNVPVLDTFFTRLCVRGQVDWRGRGQYFKATVLRVNEPVQSFDVKYAIDMVVDQRVPPYRIRGYVKERPNDPRPHAKY